VTARRREKIEVVDSTLEAAPADTVKARKIQ